MSKAGLFILGLQHLFTMFGATVLVPYLTEVPVTVALFAAGVGTLLFHVINKSKVPIFLGSSFAYIAPINAVILYYANVPKAIGSVPEALASGFAISPEVIGYATGGILLAGLFQVVIAFIIKQVGLAKFEKLFSPAVISGVIIVIGLNLAPVAVSMASSNWWLAVVTLITVIVVRLYAKGFTKALPVLAGIAVGYVVAAIFGYIDFSGITSAAWVGVPQFILPRFSLYSLLVILPVAIAPTIEHFGDIFAVSAIVGKKFYLDPGIPRTLTGDGLATALAGAIGAPANTTYSENTGVLALTKVFNPIVMQIAAVCAIILSFIPKVGAVIQSIPVAVMGGIEIILFGMIASVGIKTLITSHKVKELADKDLLILAIMLVVGLGGAMVSIGTINFSGIGLAAIVGIVLNLIFILTKRTD